ncbi:putative platelet-activating factor acetylhydrolase IB subunit beta [Lucilia cuprina]|uniref:Putative platelet-activating factor acetylhydrolase IB subunit beta n=1 Tax=Lucilia cuprina TaxID=7375 RepID=A0A0L0C9S7_LUCCU|nr:platelet-activating factor acetylhydrolase IB subunit beta homolog [Lucilia cuprina]XP_037805844.1 platelet-activating factor acetylhydrolase IB subunit beta homolog [Lucilia sericata]KAI8128327.1 Platelet-activating factor acetylhydrolase IB subunit beta like protein [Lucilia cuprina]KNC28960.1 putative platelet-activating factor acetylhydrolase IB subunit beta [Lucilia cuprina]
MNPCTVATQRKDNEGDDRWLSIHKRFISECREKDPDVIFLGDCILETLQDTETWHDYFAPMHCLNFSIRGDRCENVLWRVENGELDNVKPKIVVLHVGTNNVDNKPEEIADGIYEIIQRIRSKLPDAYIVLPSLLPRGHQPNKLRDKNAQVNSLIKEKVVGLNRVQTVDIAKGLVQMDDSISHHDMFDYKNLTNTGAKKVFEPVHDLLSQILNENEQERDLTPSE